MVFKLESLSTFEDFVDFENSQNLNAYKNNALSHVLPKIEIYVTP